MNQSTALLDVLQAHLPIHRARARFVAAFAPALIRVKPNAVVPTHDGWRDVVHSFRGLPCEESLRLASNRRKTISVFRYGLDHLRRLLLGGHDHGAFRRCLLIVVHLAFPDSGVDNVS